MLLILCIALLNVHAQNVERVEYFTDTDPGFGAGNNVPITQGQQDLAVNFQFNINSLSVGFHNLYIRSFASPYQVVADGITVTKGGWSLATIRTFYKENITNVNNALTNITAGEFFIDTDPGYGKANNINFIAGNDINNLDFTFDVTGLTAGFHNLYVRFRDANGTWSTVDVRNFYKEALSNVNNIFSNIISGEYFIDTDPGFGKATNIPVVAGSSDITNLNFTFDVTTLTPGFHNLYVRFRDTDGKWSTANVRNFYKEALSNSNNIFSNIISGEFFIDTDPGFGKATNIPVVAGSSDITNLNFTFDVTTLTPGFHNLYVRFKDADGKWSTANIRNFYKENLAGPSNVLPAVVAGEFFLDTDPGLGKGNTITIGSGVDLKNVNFLVDITGINAGFHHISVRFRDANGSWGHTNSRSFYKETLSSPGVQAALLLTLRLQSILPN